MTIYLSGHPHPRLARRFDAGWLLTPRMGNRPDLDGTVWAVDNGCFVNPNSFDAGHYLDWLADPRARTFRRRCLFVTAPDMPGDWTETLARSLPVLPRIRDLGYPAALIAQDGLYRPEQLPWGEFDALFIGGTTRYKLSETAARLVDAANDRGLWTHYGRVNSWSRLKAAYVYGVDSADGTFLAFGPDKNLVRLERWLEQLAIFEATAWCSL
jgi:hypothetical protein